MPDALPPTMPPPAMGVVTLPPPMPGRLPDTAPATLESGAAALSPSIMPTLAGDAVPVSRPPSMPPARYELGAEIARGGMGRVVEATDTLLGRVVALKEVLAGDSDTLQRFARETRITARLEHPSIVPLHDAGSMAGGAPYYVMRKISGRPLEHLVALAETLEQRLVLVPHIVAASQAIAHAHERGIVHRDIKPSNILVGALGETIVIDWGLAKVIGEPDDARMDLAASLTAVPPLDDGNTIKTRAGIVFGTPGFMAPEQLRGKPVTERCDVYALGATLYHLLSRKPPHHAKTADEMMKSAAREPPQPIAQLVPGVPPELATIVDKALAHDPDTRYQDARALAEDLQRFLSGQLVRSHYYTRRERLVRFLRKNRIAVSIVTATALLAIAVGIISIIRVIGERDRADAAAVVAVAAKQRADDQRMLAERRADALTLARASDEADSNPTRAIATLKPIAAKYWREARAIAAAARAHGIAHGMPAAPRTTTLELSREGTHALAAGDDGTVRLYDLAKRTSRTLPIAPAGSATAPAAPVSARFADSDRQVAVWRDRTLRLVDTATGATTRTVTAPAPILDLTIAGTTAYWVDQPGALYQLDLAGGGPAPIELPERITKAAPSPDGRYLALAGSAHLLVLDRTRPTAAPKPLLEGVAKDFHWSTDGSTFAVLIDTTQGTQGMFVETAPSTSIVWKSYAGPRHATLLANDLIYTIGTTGISIVARDPREGGPRKQLVGAPVGLAQARGGSIVAGGRGGITVLSPHGDHVLPVPAGAITAVAAHPQSPYVVAAIEGRLLLWNLDEIEPRRVLPVGPSFLQLVDANHAIVTISDHDIRWIDLATGKITPLAEGTLRSIAGSPAGDLACAIDSDRSATLLGPDGEPREIEGTYDLAGFADAERLLLGQVPDGAVHLYEPRTGKRTPLFTAKGQLLDLAWSRGAEAWAAASFDNGSLWRKNLTTNAEATADAKIPAPGSLLVTRTGTVLFADGRILRAWRPNGALDPHVELPRPIAAISLAGPGHVLAVLEDSSTYLIDLAIPNDARPSGSLSGQLTTRNKRVALAMAADAGTLVAPSSGGLEIVDPLASYRWTLTAQPPLPKLYEQVTPSYSSPLISADGTRVIARLPSALVAWSIQVPATADDTAKWLGALTNAAIDTQGSGKLVWQ